MKQQALSVIHVCVWYSSAYTVYTMYVDTGIL